MLYVSLMIFLVYDFFEVKDKMMLHEQNEHQVKQSNSAIDK
ncbi:protein of unknown function [Brochothrix thermosphacta]|nr:protein of unknown function [Brochothrix thermosphacta]